MKRTAVAFSLIELMIAMTATLFLVATFFRVFTHATRLETNNNLKNNVSLKGEHILDSLENSIRLIGLANNSTEFSAGAVIPSAQGKAVSVGAGNYLTGTFNFSFRSPWGGPITKVVSATGTQPACVVTIMNSNSLFAELDNLLFINKNDIYTATFSAGSTGNTFTTATITSTNPLAPAIPSGVTCDSLFPSSTLVTGANTLYELAFDGSIIQFRDATWNRIIFAYPKEEMPFFVLQFLVETSVTDGEGELYANRAWAPSVNDCGSAQPDVCKTIKAVRFGFVLTSRESRIDKGTDSGTFQYCLFDDSTCFSANANTGKRYFSFSRTVYMRNYDFMKDYELEQ